MIFLKHLDGHHFQQITSFSHLTLILQKVLLCLILIPKMSFIVYRSMKLCIKILFDYLCYNTWRNYTKLYLNLQITEKWNLFFTGKDITDELVQLSSSVSNRNKRAVDSPWEGLAGVDTSYDPQVCIDNGLINPHLN